MATDRFDPLRSDRAAICIREQDPIVSRRFDAQCYPVLLTIYTFRRVFNVHHSQPRLPIGAISGKPGIVFSEDNVALVLRTEGPAPVCRKAVQVCAPVSAGIVQCELDRYLGDMDRADGLVNIHIRP